MKFEGVGRREFSFEFRMLPNNSKEAENIEKIVTAFRYHAMPEIEGSDLSGRTMIAPSTFDIEYFPNTHIFIKYLPLYYRCSSKLWWRSYTIFCR